MSAGFDIDTFGGKGGEKPTRCAVVAIYEDHGSRQLLLRLSDSLARNFNGDVEFQFDWCRFKYLADPEVAMEAADKATRADLILFAPNSAELPKYVQGWFEGWLSHREASNGALVLVQPSSKTNGRSLPLQSYLRTAARRGKLDYLRLGSPDSLMKNPLSGVSMTQLQMQLSADNPPVHWGINE